MSMERVEHATVSASPSRDAISAPIAVVGRERQRLETRRRLYESAITVFRRDGVSASKIEDIVKLASVSRGTFYFHFPSKDDVLLVLLGASEARIVAALETLPAGAPMIDVLEKLASAFAQEWQDEPRIFPDVVTVGLRTTAAGAPREPGTIRAALSDRLADATAREGLNDGLPHDVLADFYLANMAAAALAWCGNPVASLHSVLQVVTTLFFYGIRGAAR